MWDVLTTNWMLLLPLLTGALGLLALLPQPRGLPRAVGAGLLVLTIILAGFGIGSVTSVEQGGLVEKGLFYGFSFIAVLSAISLVTQVQPARAALSFTLVVLATSGLFLLLAAPFLFAASIIVYAGAIIVTFLFVLMLAQQTGRGDADRRSREPLFSVITGLLLLGTLFYLIQQSTRVELQRQGNKQTELQWLADVADRAAESSSPVVVKELLDSVAKQIKIQQRKEQPNTDPALIIDDNMPTRLSKVLASLNMNSLADEMRNLIPDWQPGKAINEQTLEQWKDVLKKIRDVSKLAVSQLPLKEVHHLSNLSGPVGVPAVELRRDATGNPAMPAENAAYLGKSLFTDYLLPVELGGLLLLLAVVGAIVITQRQDEEGKVTP